MQANHAVKFGSSIGLLASSQLRRYAIFARATEIISNERLPTTNAMLILEIESGRIIQSFALPVARIAKIQKRSDAVSAGPSTRFKLWQLVLGGLLLVGVGVGGTAIILSNWSSHSVAASNPPSGSQVESNTEKQIGPWGELEISDIQIDPPDEYAANLFIPTNHGVWFFGAGYDRPKILGLFDSTDLTGKQRSELADPACWETSVEGIRITLNPGTVSGLGSTARSRIYRALAEFRENFFQASPFMFPKERAGDWFFHSGLTTETISLISGLFYERGNMLCFSDVGVLSQISSDAEKARLITALSRTPSVLVNLRIPTDADPDPLIRYWHRTGNASEACQLIKSVAHGRNGGSIDVALLLPTFVREHVYHYPQISSDLSSDSPDCLWSALSFVRERPDYKTVDEAYLISRLKDEYEPVQGSFQNGDVLVLASSSGKVLHYCVHIAGSIVFTKNGSSVFSPWVLMRFKDVIGFYSSDAAPRIICFRKKVQAAGS